MLLFVVIDMRSKAGIVSKLMFKLLRELEYRLGDGFQDEGSVLATRLNYHSISHKFENGWDLLRKVDIELWLLGMDLKYPISHIHTARATN